MRRRRIITLLIHVAVAWPLVALAQQPAVSTVGFLNSGSVEAFAPFVAAFVGGLRETGFTEGQNLTIEYRWARGQYDRLPALAADLVARHVAVIAATGGTVSARAASAATETIPIVFNIGADPVELGLVASLSRPGGNATGMSLVQADLTSKRLELLRDLIPKATAIAFLLNPSSPLAGSQRRAIETAVQAGGQKLQLREVGTEADIDEAFATLAERRPDALLVATDPFFNTRRDQLVALAARHRIPAIYEWREFADAGGLMSYGPSLTDAYRQVGIYTGRILAGAKPADLPVLQPSRFELVINLKAARALGLDLPPAVLLRADEVIE